MADRYVAIHESQARTRKLPGYEEPADWHEDNGWALFECDDTGTPVRLVFCDRMEPEDAILVRDLRPLVAELNLLASRAPSPPETPAPVHYLARYAAGSLIACDPTIKGQDWTTDPLAVTCEECRKVVRWRCEQIPAPETPAPDADRCDCDGQKGQGCTICSSSETPATEGSELAKIERLLNEYGLSMYEEGRHRGRDEGSDRKRKAVLSAIRSCAASPASSSTDPDPEVKP